MFTLWIRVNPRFGEIDNIPFCVLARLESIREPADRMRTPPTFPRPGNFHTRTPLLVALDLRCEGNDQ